MTSTTSPSILLWGLSAEDITALATVILTASTLALAVVTWLLALAARKQLPLLTGQLTALSEQVRLAQVADATAREHDKATTEQERKRNEAAERRYIEGNTLAACARYTGDIVVHGAAKRVWQSSDGGTDYRTGQIDIHDLITTLNYLDSIATGVKQGVFSAGIVQDHMGSTFEKVVDVIIPHALNGDFTGYEASKWLRESWRAAVNVTYADRDRT